MGRADILLRQTRQLLRYLAGGSRPSFKTKKITFFYNYFVSPRRNVCFLIRLWIFMNARNIYPTKWTNLKSINTEPSTSVELTELYQYILVIHVGVTKILLPLIITNQNLRDVHAITHTIWKGNFSKREMTLLQEYNI